MPNRKLGLHNGVQLEYYRGGILAMPSLDSYSYISN